MVLEAGRNQVHGVHAVVTHLERKLGRAMLRTTSFSTESLSVKALLFIAGAMASPASLRYRRKLRRM